MGVSTSCFHQPWEWSYHPALTRGPWFPLTWSNSQRACWCSVPAEGPKLQSLFLMPFIRCCCPDIHQLSPSTSHPIMSARWPRTYSATVQSCSTKAGGSGWRPGGLLPAGDSVYEGCYSSTRICPGWTPSCLRCVTSVCPASVFTGFASWSSTATS